MFRLVKSSLSRNSNISPVASCLRQFSHSASVHREDQFHSTTVLNVRKGNQIAMIADGQISLGSTVFKNTAKKVRVLPGNVMCGFAGTAADCLAIIELLEKEMIRYPG